MYIFNFQTQHHFSTNLPSVALLTKFKDTPLILEQEHNIYDKTNIQRIYLNLPYILSPNMTIYPIQNFHSYRTLSSHPNKYKERTALGIYSILTNARNHIMFLKLMVFNIYLKFDKIRKK